MITVMLGAEAKTDNGEGGWTTIAEEVFDSHRVSGHHVNAAVAVPYTHVLGVGHVMKAKQTLP